MINIRTHNDFAAQAALKGVKMEFKKVKRQVEELSVEQKQMMSEVVKKAAQRKIMEKVRGKGRGHSK